MRMHKLLEVFCVLILALGASASADAIRPDSDLVSNSGKSKSGPLVFNNHPLDARKETDAIRPGSDLVSYLGKGKADPSVFNNHPLDARRETIAYCFGGDDCKLGSSPQDNTFLVSSADDYSPIVVEEGLGSADDLLPVPEPASLVLLGSGLLTAAGVRRRKLLG